jgi:predicted metal-dependent RNase
MLLDFVKIQRSDSNGKDPLFSTDDIKEMVKHTITLEYNEVSDITPDVRITLYNAGHILGSSMVHMHVGNGLHNILYSGDHKYGRTMLLDPAVTVFPRLETLLLESTYGGKDSNTPERQSSDEELKRIVQETVKRKGKVLIPTLGVGRSQEIMVVIENMVRNGTLENIPVYIDGLIWDVTAIHTAYPEYLNSSIRKQIFHKDQNPFLSDIFKRVGSQKERMQVIEETGSCVILATSGMLQGGPSVEYLRHLADNPKNSMIFVNYQGEGSLGRRVQRGEKEYSVTNGSKSEVVQIKLEVHTVEGFSGHSSRNQLLNFVSKCEPRPKKVIINHGESSKCLDLASTMHKNFRIETSAPRNLESVRIK